MNFMKKRLSLLFSIAMAFVLLGCASVAPLERQSDGQEDAAPSEVSRMGIEESKAAFDSGDAIFLDVRSESSYATGHFPGALSIPLTELEDRINELDPGDWIITYCT